MELGLFEKITFFPPDPLVGIHIKKIPPYRPYVMYVPHPLGLRMRDMHKHSGRNVVLVAF
jgi:hypothetical protein